MASEETPIQSEKSRFLRVYLPMSLVCSAIVFGITYNVAWNFLTMNLANRPRQEWTFTSLQYMKSKIEEYREEHGRLPSQIADLDLERTNKARYKKEDFSGVDARKCPLDGWNRPFHFEFSEEAYEIVSWGRDGKPGGMGLDADWSSDSEFSWTTVRQHRPTFRQFIQTRDDLEIIGSDVLMWAFICGALTMGIFFTRIRSCEQPIDDADNQQEELKRTAISPWDITAHVIGTLMFAGFISLVLVFVHARSGH